MKYSSIFIALALTCSFVNGQVMYVNEVLATNSSVCYDENGEYDDFIEIYIPTSTSFSLTDKLCWLVCRYQYDLWGR